MVFLGKIEKRKLKSSRKSYIGAKRKELRNVRPPKWKTVIQTLTGGGCVNVEKERKKRRG